MHVWVKVYFSAFDCSNSHLWCFDHVPVFPADNLKWQLWKLSIPKSMGKSSTTKQDLPLLFEIAE